MAFQEAPVVNTAKLSVGLAVKSGTRMPNEGLAWGSSWYFMYFLNGIEGEERTTTSEYSDLTRL